MLLLPPPKKRGGRKGEEQFKSEKSVMSLSLNLSIFLNREHKQQYISNVFVVLLFHPSEEDGGEQKHLFESITLL